MSPTVANLSAPPGFTGEFITRETLRRLYATDASAYEEIPAAVAFPREPADLGRLVQLAIASGVPLIPRAAGTSLAGQVVGSGIVIDVSRHLTAILSVDPEHRLARVQPGVIRNDLNHHLRPHGLFFAPETATQSRATLGGMFGNNSCGSNSVRYGTTRDHLLAVEGYLSDGSFASFGPLQQAEFHDQRHLGSGREAEIYRQIQEIGIDASWREKITAAFPDPRIRRRNTGYALDCLLAMRPFGGDERFNLAPFLAGSEGTLFLASELTVHLEPLPPVHGGLLCAHFATVAEAIAANLVALEADPHAVELIDAVILGCTRDHPGYQHLRFFVEGEPGALLVIDLRDEDAAAVEGRLEALRERLRAAGLGYAHPIVRGEAQALVWELRNAGLGLLANVKGSKKPVPVIEDAAVAPEDLPAYVEQIGALAKGMGIDLVHYAHAGSGELHIRPILDLQSAEGRAQFRAIAEGAVKILQGFRGSLSGEHGDGRLRSEFIEQMVGPEVYGLMREIKRTWDPGNLFNPGKIIDPVPMDVSFRQLGADPTIDPATVFDYTGDGGLRTMAARCNGTGDCRRSHLSGGTMCPSYMATRHEKDTTRARANMLRQVMAGGGGLGDKRLDEAMELCLSCKACKSECPSRVDVAKMKAEYLQARHDQHGAPWRIRMVADYARWQRLGMRFPILWNTVSNSGLMKRILGFAPQRSIPPLPRQSLRVWYDTRPAPMIAQPKGTVIFFGDEFTATTDTAIGIATIELLEGLGYRVEWPEHGESGRTWLSQGFLREARKIAETNVAHFGRLVSPETPLVGVEPSALLCFRDEYPELVGRERSEKARTLGKNAFLLDEFIAREAAAGRISPDAFEARERTVFVHGHCYQKALASMAPAIKMLELIPAQTVKLLPTGCCGMAGAFGYWDSKYAVSQQIGELVLFPAARAIKGHDLLVAAGTSCRHQVLDGADIHAHHPAELLREALRS